MLRLLAYSDMWVKTVAILAGCFIVFLISLIPITDPVPEDFNTHLIPPEVESQQAIAALQADGLFEGDIVGLPPFKNKSADRRWPNGKIYYLVEPELLPFIEVILNKAMQHIMMMTGGCVTFIPRSDQDNFVYIINGDGCFSYIGFMEIGPQLLSLGVGCRHLGSVMHELLHTVGLKHERILPSNESDATVMDDLQDRESFFEFNEDSIMTFNGDITDNSTQIFVHLKTSLADSDADNVKQLYQCEND